MPELIDKQLLEAIYNNKISIADNLIKDGANVDAVLNDGFNITTPLISAIKLVNAEMVSLLITNHANPNLMVTGDYGYDVGYTPLCLALQTMNLVIASMLISAGADVNARVGRGQYEGSTLLGFATARGTFNGVKLLIDNGADVNAVMLSGGMFEGLTALEIAKSDLFDYALSTPRDSKIIKLLSETTVPRPKLRQ